jgi:hypothetical protein
VACRPPAVNEAAVRAWSDGESRLARLYAVAGAHVDNAGAKTRLYWVLGGAALLAGGIALIGRVRGWQERRGLLVGWPAVSLIVTIVVGAIDPSVTGDFPGSITITITITFAYVGLACGRWRSLAMVPLGVAAFVVGGSKVLAEGGHGLPYRRRPVSAATSSCSCWSAPIAPRPSKSWIGSAIAGLKQASRWASAPGSLPESRMSCASRTSTGTPTDRCDIIGDRDVVHGVDINALDHHRVTVRHNCADLAPLDHSR